MLWQILLLAVIAQTKITQLHSKNFHDVINQNQYTLLYFFSSSCRYCKQFTPKYQKLQNNAVLAELKVSLAKMDGVAYQNLTHSLEVYSYPGLVLFRKGVFLPIHYRQEREPEKIIEFIKKITLPSFDPNMPKHLPNLTLADRIHFKIAVLYGKKDSKQYEILDVIAKRDGFLNWGYVQSEENIIQLGDRNLTVNNGTQIEEAIQEVYARLHSISEESWLKMADKKLFTIIYFNKHGNKKTKSLVTKLAKELSKVNFIQIDGEHQEYKSALRFLSLPDEENIVSVDKKYEVIYIADSPYSQSSLQQFIDRAQKHNLTLYRKTQKSEKPNKLTRANYDQKMSTNQDVLLFLYNKKQQISKELMTVFEYVSQKLKDNHNLSILRCDVEANEIEEKLGFIPKPTPRVIFLRNRQKDYPIHFSGKTISVKTIIQFITENTTFDYKDEWLEL